MAATFVVRNPCTENLALKDLFRVFNPKAKSFTFKSSAHKMQTRIDRVYSSADGASFANNCRHIPVPSVVSDHISGVEVLLRSINNVSRGPSFWKLNTSLMKRPGFAKIVVKLITDFQSLRDKYPDLRTWWDMLKLAIQLRLKEYSKQQATRRKKTILTMESQLLQVNQELARLPTDAALLDRRIRLDLLLAEYYEDIYEAARVKSGLRHKVEGERPTKYFSALAKKRAEKSALTSLVVDRNSDKVTLSTIEEILEEASDFYATLYSDKLTHSQKSKAAEYLQANCKRKLSERERQFCDEPIKLEELDAAVKKLPSGKAPGIDGLPFNFFCHFWDLLRCDFLAVLNESFASGSLPETMQMSIITLIFKKKSRQDIRNYRPISLLCTDYKIIAKALAERMKLVLPSIIHEDQTGFLKDRYIGEIITIFLDVQEYLLKTVKPGLAFLADWEKAYDLADRSFLKVSLCQFGFGPQFIQWFSVLHAGSLCKFIINSFLTDTFRVFSGVRQGCPLAPLLFLCVVEPLAEALRSSKVAGIRLPDGKRLIYSGYADDTTVYISDSKELPKVLTIFEKFSYVSGMKLNVGKCTVIPLGTLLNAQKPASCPYKWLTDGDDLERLLGVPIGIKFENEAVWKSLLLKLQDSINHWAAQNLTVYGRVHAARSYIGGKAWFLATMVPPDGKGLKRFSTMLWAFIQNNGKLQTDSNRHYSAWSGSTLIKPFIEGGLNAQDPELQMKATHSKWIFKLLDPRHIASLEILAVPLLPNSYS
jgi:hypothetical protein